MIANTGKPEKIKQKAFKTGAKHGSQRLLFTI